MLGTSRAAQLHVRFRIATVEHIERQEAREALLDAESEADYTTLLAQVCMCHVHVYMPSIYTCHARAMCIS